MGINMRKSLWQCLFFLSLYISRKWTKFRRERYLAIGILVKSTPTITITITIRPIDGNFILSLLFQISVLQESFVPTTVVQMSVKFPLQSWLGNCTMEFSFSLSPPLFVYWPTIGDRSHGGGGGGVRQVNDDLESKQLAELNWNCISYFKLYGEIQPPQQKYRNGKRNCMGGSEKVPFSVCSQILPKLCCFKSCEI